MKQPEFVVGIDLGGTNVRAAIVSQQGEIKAWAQSPIEASRGAEQGIQRIQNLIRQVMKQAGVEQIAGIGFGSTGPLDREKGFIQNPYTLPGWENVDVRTPLSQAFDAPLIMENDADAAALGEAWLGSGKGASRFALVTVGTGVGSAFILDGRIYRGMDGEHPEAGHQVLDPNGPPCYCGAKGCLESLASGPAIAERARLAVGQNPQSTLARLAQSGDALEAVQVVEAARQGDGLAQEIIHQAATYLGLGLINLILFYLPECVALGGGVMKNYDLFLPHIQQVLSQHDIVVPTHRVRITPASLGNKAGVLGAARAIWQEVKG
ncbi:MAG: glucokinase [Bellilinea sp.]|nr:MAG: glucokinase [Bellilinea sp.]